MATNKELTRQLAAALRRIEQLEDALAVQRVRSEGGFVGGLIRHWDRRAA